MLNVVKVSIIVPAYNVGQYIEKCVLSILDQSFKNIELIIINDGSTDNTLSIIEKLANKDERICIVNKNNEGVSAARNSGIEIATGDYLVFVDGDDFLAPEYVEYMLNLVSKDNSDFCLSKNCFTEEDESQISIDNIQILTKEEATALLISPKVIVGCWNKMFKRQFILENGLMFSTKLFYGEGLNFITKAAQLANNVAVGSRKVYYYRRNNEASATSKFNIQKYYNGEKALDKIQNDLLIKDVNVDLMMALHKSLFCLGALSQTYAHNMQKVYEKDCKHWRDVIKKNLGRLWKTGSVSIYRKILLTVGYINPMLISKLDMWRRLRIARKSVN